MASELSAQECSDITCNTLSVENLKTRGNILRALKCCCFERVSDPLVGKAISFNSVRTALEKVGTFNNSKFLEEFFEIQQRTFLAASLGIGGTSVIRDLSFDLPSCDGHVMKEAFLESLSRIDLSPFGESIQHSAFRMFKDMSPSTRVFDAKQLEFAATNNRGGGNHLLSIYFNSEAKQLMIGNRGRRPKDIPSGILVFSTENAEESELVGIFKFLESNETQFYRKLYCRLIRNLGPAVKHIALDEQHVGNCAWLAFEMILLSYAFAHHTTAKSDWNDDYEQSLLLLDAIRRNRVRAYLTSPSTIKSHRLLRACQEFEADAQGGIMATIAHLVNLWVPGTF